jgi:hypothetical protein
MTEEYNHLIDLRDAPYALQTYYSYVSAWVTNCHQLYGEDKTLHNINQKFQSLPSIKRMQGGKDLSQDIALNYCRGKLTFIAMQTFPISTHKELAPTANLWLPVQAYYAIHGVGISCILSLGQATPTTHKAFRASFSDLAGKYLPEPFNFLCYDGPEKSNFQFLNLKTTPQQVSEHSNLANPSYGDINAAIGKCLSSTRFRLLEDKYREARKKNVKPGRKGRKLKVDEKQSITDRLHKTSVVDFLYRMRIRSNYEEPDMYLFNTDKDEAAKHYHRLVFLTEALINSLESLIKKKIGKSNFNQLSNLLKEA